MHTRLIRLVVLLAVAASFGSCTHMSAQSSTKISGVERMHVFNCDESTVSDVSRWTPGVNVGQPGEFSANCYLIRHALGRMMFDSGINDNVATMPNGFQRAKESPRYILRKPLRAQLAEISIVSKACSRGKKSLR